MGVQELLQVTVSDSKTFLWILCEHLDYENRSRFYKILWLKSCYSLDLIHTRTIFNLKA